IPSSLLNLPPPGFVIPPSPLHDRIADRDSSGRFVGANEGRLRSDLRAAAKRADPRANLCKAAELFARNATAEANAFADLSVTGRAAFAKFRALRLQEKDLLSCPGGQGLPPHARKAALDRAYQVATVLRAGAWPSGPNANACNTRRQALGWIAV